MRSPLSLTEIVRDQIRRSGGDEDSVAAELAVKLGEIFDSPKVGRRLAHWRDIPPLTIQTKTMGTA